MSLLNTAKSIFSSIYSSIYGDPDGLTASGVALTNSDVKPESKYVKGKPGVVSKPASNSTFCDVVEDVDNTDSELIFKVPDWGYQDFIRERTSWQKGFDSATGEPGWFYFKVFFRFDTNSGLLGELLGEENITTGNVSNAPNGDDNNYKHDSAIRYLYINQGHYSKIDIAGRMIALKRFASILSFINGHAPWFFDSIGGLDKATVPDITHPFKDRTLELGFKEDAVDMRITNLIDLYKYAAFDYVDMKEIIPENLRRFDMTVVLFHTPLRWYHTGMQTMRRGTFQYKSFAADDFDDRMSYKMYTFKGCEFVTESLGNVYPSDVSNKEPFNLGNAKISINYKRVYQHTFNEWGRFMIGDDGVYYDSPKGVSKRLAAIQDAADNPYYFNPGADIFKPLVDATESRITWAMKQIQPSAVFGNLYIDQTDVNGDYYNDKLRTLKQGTKSLHTKSKR